MSAAPALLLRGVSFTYARGDRPALSGVDLDLADGEWGLLLGPSGAGKTTLVRCLNRAIPLFHPGRLEGRIAVAGGELADQRVADLARRVGVVFQDFEIQIFSSSCLLEVAFALENRCLPPETIRERARRLLEGVGLAGFEERDPATLSGGEKQRLVIAAVLALEAPVLALDEPASDLDGGGRQQVYDLIRRQRDAGPGRAVLLVEHDLEGLPEAERGVLLQEGRVSRRWEGGGAARLIDLAPLLESAGVRPPPLARLVAALEASPVPGETPGRARPRLPVERLDVETVDRALDAGGWRLATPGASAARSVGPGAGAAALIRCDGVSLVYGRGAAARPALDRLDLVIRQGEMLALVGANGSGKTTLARLLCGLQAPTSGRVLLRGRDVGSIPAGERARQVGYVFQNPDHQIFATSVWEETAFGPRNLRLPVAEVERRVGSALDAVGLTPARGEDPFTLTKGERQRLSLASVLACEPELIVMDEPTTGLDLEQQASVMSLLERLNRRGHAVLIITHALWLLAGPVERVLVIEQGRLAADGPPARVLTDEPLLLRAGLRAPDLARLAARRGVGLLSVPAWVEALVPPAAPPLH